MKKIILNIFLLICLSFGIFFHSKLTIWDDIAKNIWLSLNMIFLIIAPTVILIKENLSHVDFTFSEHTKFNILFIIVLVIIAALIIISHL